MESIKIVSQLDNNNIFLGTTTANLDELEGNGSYLMPAGSVDTAPPESREGKAARWTGSEWEYIPDLRGTIAYSTSDGSKVIVTEVGELPSTLTVIAPPTPYHEWKRNNWHLPAAKAKELKAEQQAEMWERIKEKRYNNLRSGVKVKSVGKWFHTNDESRTQYLGLGLLPAIPENLMWKTMDNSFVPMTKQLLNELMISMLTAEQADFANAERHKAAMEASANPSEYDYSDGWNTVYPIETS